MLGESTNSLLAINPWLFGLQVLLLPFQALCSGFGEESAIAFQIYYLPMLILIVVFNASGAVDFQPAQLM